MKKQKDIYDVFTPRVIFYLYAWVIFWLFVYIPLVYAIEMDLALKITIGVVFPLIPTVHVNFYFLDKFFMNRKTTRYVIMLFLLLVVSGALSQLFMYYLLYPNEESNNIMVFTKIIFKLCKSVLIRG